MAESRSAAKKGSNSKDIAVRLNGFVADSYVLFAKTQSFHWNVVGSNFQGLHSLFEAQYKELFKAIDELAERVRALDGTAPTGLRQMLDLASVNDNDDVPDNKAMCRILLEDNRALSRRAAELADAADAAEDIATHDMLVHRIEAHDKAAWMLKAHLA